VTLRPGEGAEVKLGMRHGARTLRVERRSRRSAAPRQVTSRGGACQIHCGGLEAAFDRNHGWFWRNRDDQDVTVTLRVIGDHTDIRRVV